jgi:hypothetical protein
MRNQLEKVVRRRAGAIVLIVFTALLIPSVALGAGTMGGTTFTGAWAENLGFVVAPVTATCTGPGSGTVSYRLSNGVATGTNPGFFFESGTVTIVNNVITAWDVGWSLATVPNGEVYVSGQKHLNAAGAATFSCSGASATGSLDATLDYTATYQPNTPRPPGTPNTGSDGGLATASLTFTTSSIGDPAGPGLSSGTFSEIFLVPGPVAPTKKDECKDGGYATFPMFKNQGECVAFVNHLP